MGVQKFNRPLLAPEFTPMGGDLKFLPEDRGLAQVPMSQGDGSTQFVTISGDVNVDALGNATLVNSSVSAGNLRHFFVGAYINGAVIGTGEPQDIYHGLSEVPAVILVIPIDGGSVAYHDGDRTVVVNVTLTAGKKYDVLAIA